MSEKVLVVSDSHGNNTNLRKALSYFGERGRELSMLVHLGDSQGNLEELQEIAACPVEAVRGNCDYDGRLPIEKVITIGGRKVFITHGHRYACLAGTDFLAQTAREQGAGIALFGHTHVPLVEDNGGILVCNPGSISKPRQPGYCPTYLVFTLEDDGRLEHSIVKMS